MAKSTTDFAFVVGRKINMVAACTVQFLFFGSFARRPLQLPALALRKYGYGIWAPKTKISLFPTRPPPRRHSSGGRVRRIVRIFANCRPRERGEGIIASRSLSTPYILRSAQGDATLKEKCQGQMQLRFPTYGKNNQESCRGNLYLILFTSFLSFSNAASRFW